MAQTIQHYKYRSTSSGTAGFTLLELLAVMMIMGIMATVVTTAYVGMMRGAGMREAINQLRSTIILARQKAITDGNKVTLFFEWNNAQNKVEYYIVQAAGMTTEGTAGTTLKDEYNLELKDLERNSKIYNLKTGSYALVSDADLDVNGIPYANLQTDGIFGSADVRYGFLLHTEHALPAGFVFKLDNPEKPEVMNLEFFPDGTVTGRDGTPRPIAIYEEINVQRTVEIIVSEYGSLATHEEY